MAKINAKLLGKIKSKSGLSQSRVYGLIDAAAMTHMQPKNVAALVVARDFGINIFKYATPEEISALQGIKNNPSVQPSTAPIPAAAIVTAGARQVAKKKATPAKASKKRENAVFVVHGRDLKARDNLAIFLRSLNIDVIEWEKALVLTKKANPYIKEVIDAGFAHAQAIVVLLTPDDEAKLGASFIRKGEQAFEKKLMGQPRQNVLFEAGLAFGRCDDTTILVQVGRLRPMSDVAGIHTVHLTGSAASRKQLIGKLKTTGVRYDDSGTDWLTHGGFSKFN